MRSATGPLDAFRRTRCVVPQSITDDGVAAVPEHPPSMGTLKVSDMSIGSSPAGGSAGDETGWKASSGLLGPGACCTGDGSGAGAAASWTSRAAASAHTCGRTPSASPWCSGSASHSCGGTERSAHQGEPRGGTQALVRASAQRPLAPWKPPCWRPARCVARSANRNTAANLYERRGADVLTLWNSCTEWSAGANDTRRPRDALLFFRPGDFLSPR